MKRKLLSLALVLAMALTLFPASALAAGGTGQPVLERDGFRFRLGNEGAYVVKRVDSTLTDITIPERFDEFDVVGIDDGAFKDTDITSVTIPEGVEYIGESAFEGCKKLTDVTFEGAYADLSANCFKDCTALEQIYVPDTGVIYEGTFEGCTNLGIVLIEDGNMIIDEGAFKGCTNLEYIRIPVSMEQIYTQDFKGLKDVVVSGIKSKTGDRSAAERFAEKMGFTLVPEEYPADEEAWFSDVKDGSYYSVPVLWGAMTGVIAGYDDGSFGPDDPCTRAQMVAFLWRFNGCPESKVEPSQYHCFSDVPSNAYYTKAVQWAYEEGITAGTDTEKNTFSPDDTVTRAMVIAMLHRMDAEPEATATTTPFKDVNTKAYYYNALLWASENKVVAGKETDQFAPNDPCTRAQIISFMYRNVYHWYYSYDSEGEFVS